MVYFVAFPYVQHTVALQQNLTYLPLRGQRQHQLTSRLPRDIISGTFNGADYNEKL